MPFPTTAFEVWMQLSGGHNQHWFRVVAYAVSYAKHQGLREWHFLIMLLLSPGEVVTVVIRAKITRYQSVFTDAPALSREAKAYEYIVYRIINFRNGRLRITLRV